MKKKGIHIDSLDAFYESYHLKTSKNEFNMTAYLLSDQNIIMIRVIQFAGKDRTKMIKKNDMTSDMLKERGVILEQTTALMIAKNLGVDIESISNVIYNHIRTH
jgi:hypothetical protein